MREVDATSRPERLIGLAITGSLSFYRSLVRGIAHYAHEHPHWNLTFVNPQISQVSRRALEQVDAAIVTIGDRKWCDFLLEIGVPVINIDAVLPGLPIPRLNVDDRSVGAMAAEHFLERGFQSFGFVGHEKLLFSRERQAAFEDALAASGFQLEVFAPRGKNQLGPLGLSRVNNQEFGRWLDSLPRPAGILTPDDLWGLEIVEFCRQRGLRVPEDIAVLGVDNDDLFCGISSPPLSSIILPSEAMGYRAAEEAETLIETEAAGLKEDILFPPIGIAVRKSTDIFAVENPHILAALSYIRENSHRPIRVADVLEHVQVSRRWLERHMLDSVGVSLGEQIRRTRLQRAKQLLISSSLSIADIATRAGYTSLRHIESVFRAELSCSPSQFRSEAIKSR